MDKPLQRFRCPIVCVLLVLLTLAAFWPVLNNEFVKYDDDKYVTENPHVTGRLTGETILWAFTRPHFYMWHPLTSLSHILDYQLFGPKPFGHHLVGLLLHAANAVLLFWVLRRMTGAIWPSVFVAAVFAVHPLQVESVAWVAERKNLLSTFFWILTIAAYVRYARRPRIGGYLLVVLTFAFALMSKPMVVTLPFVLLLLDYWPLGRLRWGPENQPVPSTPDESQISCPRQFSTRYLLAEKIPLLLLAAAVCVVTVIFQQSGKVLSALESTPLNYRVINALVSYLTYIEKLFWPSRLAVFYPHPGGDFSIGRLVASVILLVSISVGSVYAARRRKYVIVGWLWFVGTLVPVIGLVQAGAQARADRYMYMTMTGLLIIIAFGAADLIAGRRFPKVLPAFLAVVALLAATVCTRLQLKHWKNSMALFEHALSVTRPNYIIENNYANLLADLGESDQAIERYTKCLQFKPDSAEVHNNLAIVLQAKGNNDDAVAHYTRAIELAEPHSRGGYVPRGFAEAHYNLANLLRLQGRHEQALEHYTEALKLRPKNADTIRCLGLTLAALKRFDQAVEHYNRLLELEPDNVLAHGLLALALAAQGKVDQAIEHCRVVLQQRPDDVEMRCNLGLLLQRQNKTAEAIKEYRRALQIAPDNDKARRLLEAALAEKEK